MTANPPRGQQAGADATTAEGIQPVLDQLLDGDSLYQLRASVAAHATEAGLAQHRADDLVIAVHELAANVVRHGSGRGRLRIWKHRRALHCQVTDEGPGQDGDGADDPVGAGGEGAREQAAAPAWKIQPGHGLWLVRQLADRTSLHPGPRGSAVTISFRLGPAGGLPFLLTRQRSRRGATVLAVAGQLDLNSSGQLTEAVGELMAAAPAPYVVIDLAELVFWDVFGIAALLRAQAQAEARPSARLVLADVPGPLLHQLSESGLSGRFTIAGTAEEATGEIIQPP